MLYYWIPELAKTIAGFSKEGGAGPVDRYFIRVERHFDSLNKIKFSLIIISNHGTFKRSRDGLLGQLGIEILIRKIGRAWILGLS